MIKINKLLSEKEVRKISNERLSLLFIYLIVLFLILFFIIAFFNQNPSYHILSYIILITILLIFFKDLHDAIMYQTLFKMSKHRS